METRERILDAAINVFHKQGVTRSSLEEIAESAGVTRGAIYWHFKNKADIFSALHDRLHVPIMTELLQRQEKPSENPLCDLAEFSVFYLKELENNPQKQKICRLFMLPSDYSGEIASLIKEHNDKKADSLKLTAGFFRSAVKKGVIAADSDTELLALSFFCYICGICTEYLRHPKLFDLSRQAQPLVAQFFRPLSGA